MSTSKRKYNVFITTKFFEEVTWVDRFNFVLPTVQDGDKLVSKYSKRNLDLYGFGKVSEYVSYYKYVDINTGLPIFRRDGDIEEIRVRVKRDIPPEGCFEKITVPFEKWAGNPSFCPSSYDEFDVVPPSERDLEKQEYYTPEHEPSTPLLTNSFLPENQHFHPPRMHTDLDSLPTFPDIIEDPPLIPYIHRWYPPHILTYQRPEMILSLIIEGINLSSITSVNISTTPLYFTTNTTGTMLFIEVLYTQLYTLSERSHTSITLHFTHNQSLPIHIPFLEK